jgi:hypothetical protein
MSKTLRYIKKYKQGVSRDSLLCDCFVYALNTIYEIIDWFSVI